MTLSFRRLMMSEDDKVNSDWLDSPRSLNHENHFWRAPIRQPIRRIIHSSFTSSDCTPVVIFCDEFPVPFTTFYSTTKAPVARLNVKRIVRLIPSYCRETRVLAESGSADRSPDPFLSDTPELEYHKPTELLSSQSKRRTITSKPIAAWTSFTSPTPAS
jgi:hypothetical protein